jgi:hypothetical protein
MMKASRFSKLLPAAYPRERAGSNPAARAMRRMRSATAAFVIGGEHKRPSSSRLASG